MNMILKFDDEHDGINENFYSNGGFLQVILIQSENKQPKGSKLKHKIQYSYKSCKKLSDIIESHEIC